MLNGTVGRFQIVRALVGAMLVGSVALAQQGLIIEPWRKPPAPAAAPVPPLHAMPAAAAKPASAVTALERKVDSGLPPTSAAAPLRWSPPVVELLVDPWAKGQTAAPARSRWVPSSVEIVDPWADDAPASEPRVASRQPSTPHHTIF